MKRILVKLSLLVLFAFSAAPAFASLLGIDRSTGDLYSISPVDASKTLIGNTGLISAGDLTFAPNGTLYAMTDSGGAPALYRVDPTTAASTLIGLYNIGFVFEGALAIASDGTTAYSMNSGNNSNAHLLQINLSTGAATDLGVVSGATDVNGFAFRSDGLLDSLDDNTNSIRVIDPTALTSTFLASAPSTVGAIGGMTIENGIGYYATGALGTDSLFSFDPITGASTLIGNLGFTDSGLSGLALSPSSVATPEPSTLALGLIGLGTALGVTARKRKHNLRDRDRC